MSFLAFAIVTKVYIWPRLRVMRRTDALVALVIAHTFRFVGLSFLIPGVVSPSLSSAFAIPAAYGDLVAAILAGVATLALAARASWAIPIVWVFNVWGTGKVPEKDWLTGDRLGWRGPWGTTYAGNLRTYMNAISESQWVKIAHTGEFRPPMPWFALHEMTEQDLRAIYRFVKHLGPSVGPEPSYLPPDQEPKGPYVLFPQPPK
jgi:hypothetical protein